MPLTFKNLIDDVEGYLYSYGMQRDRVTTLVNPISPTDLTLQASDARVVDRGYVEADQELMAVASVEASSNIITLHPWGRGQRGTTAAAHAGNSKMTVNPRFPRSVIATKIQQTLRSCYPDLYRIGVSTANVATATSIEYVVPAEADSIVSVSYDAPNLLDGWQQITRYRFSQDADTTDFPTGKSLTVRDFIQPGRVLRIAYRSGFGTFTSETDTLASVGGQDRWADLLTFGTVGTLILAMEPMRMESDAVETQQRAETTTVTQATTVARQLLGMYKQRIAEERSLLHAQHPAVIVRRF